MTTLREVASRAGVSLSTASRVVNGTLHVKDETRQRVLKAAQDLAYALPPSPRAKTLGLIVPAETGRDIGTHPTVFSILMGVASRCAEARVSNTLLPANAQSEPPAADAYILVGTDQTLEDALLPRLLATGAPVVAVNRAPENERVSSVNIDDFGASFAATNALVGAGHRRIGFLNGNPNMRNSARRFEGYAAALAEAGLAPFAPALFTGEYDEATGERAAKTLAALAVRPTAMMTSSDTLALGLMKGLARLGFALPEAMSVIGFGDVPEAAFAAPPLTTVRMHAEAMGREAAELALRMLENRALKRLRVEMECELIMRRSVQAIRA